MNAPNTAEASALSPARYELSTQVDAQALVLNPDYLKSMMAVAELMATGRSTVPKHLQGNKGDCLALTMQAVRWHMDPFAVAQKTHVVNGTLGYEAQLVSAVINSSGATKDRLHFEWFGDWEKIVGKFKTVESKTKKDDDGNFKKYIVPDWKPEDERGLGVKVWATLRGETAPRELTLLMAQARTRNSTLWTEDPKQQIAYLAEKRWGRLYTSDVLLGVYTPDELAEGDPPEKFMGPADVVQPTNARAQSASGLPEWTDDDMAKREPKIREFYSKGKTADEIIAFYGSKGALSPAHQQKIRDLAPAAKAADTAAQVTDAEPKVTFADIAGQIARAGTEDDVAVAEDLIGSISNLEHRAELVQKAKERRAELSKEA